MEEPFLGGKDRTATSLMPIFTLLVTICLESIGTLFLKRSFDGIGYCVVAYSCYFASLALFSVVLKRLPLAIAYTTWCALGTVLVSVGSYFLYNERISWQKSVCIACTIPSVVGMYVFP
jgi:small multidrug resistance pump